MPTRDPEKLRAKRKRYRAKHAERLREYNREWRLDNPEYQREWATANPDYRREYGKVFRQKPEQVEKNAARSKVGHRIRSGEWPQASFFICTDCSLPAKEYHHEDYDLWWSVEPLCLTCHGKRHRILPVI